MRKMEWGTGYGNRNDGDKKDSITKNNKPTYRRYKSLFSLTGYTG